MDARMATQFPLGIGLGAGFCLGAGMGVTLVVGGAWLAARADNCRARAVADGGRLTVFPPVVRRAPAAAPVAQDVRLYVEF